MRVRGGATSVVGFGALVMVAAVVGSCGGGDAERSPSHTQAQPSLSGCPQGAACTTATVPIVADTELWSNSPDGAYGSSSLILSRTYFAQNGAPHYHDHTLLRFDTSAVQSALGATRELVRAELWLHGSPNVSPANGAVAVRRLLLSWDELTACWNRARSTPPTPWAMAPWDGDGVTWEATGTTADLHDVTSGGLWKVDVTHAVEAFLGGETNHGIVLYRAADEALADTYFHSREDADPDLRPSLVLTLAEATAVGGPSAPQGDFGAQVSDIWSGGNAIQSGFNPTNADWHRLAVVRGEVQVLSTPTKTFPFGGVTVSVVGHPEFGSATTRADGTYELGVYGGGPLALRFTHTGYNELQRTVDVPWQDWRVAPTVVMSPEPATAMLPPGGGAAKITEGASGWQARLGGVSPRQYALLVPPGTRVRQPDGSFVGAWRAGHHEYTVDGPLGPLQMPGTLPPTSAYTYADEWTVNSINSMSPIHGTTFTDSAGDPSTVSIYVEPVVDIPTGVDVPTGYYDRAAGHWSPERNGRVIHILGPGGAGSLDVDVNGDGMFTGADLSLYPALGLTEPELVALRAAFGTGDRKLWRVRLAHFSPFDLNWAFGVFNALWPRLDATTEPPDSCDTNVGGSVIGCESQSLGENLDVPGTPFTLHYDTRRVVGRGSAYTVRVPLIDARFTPPPPAIPPERPYEIHVQIDVAGRHFDEVIPLAEAQHRGVLEWQWDGRDARGNIAGPSRVRVSVGYLYPLRTYASPVSAAEAFGGASGGGLGIAVLREQVELAVERGDPIGTFDGRFDGLGGWTLDAMHRYSPKTGMLYQGDGTVRRADRLGSSVAFFAGNGTSACPSGAPEADHAVALDVSLCGVTDVAVGPGGEVYVAYTDRVIVVYRHRLPDGRFVHRIHPVVTYNGVSALAYDAAGGYLYLANLTARRITRLHVGTLGTVDDSTNFSTLTLEVVAGNGAVPAAGIAADEHLDATAIAAEPTRLAVAQDGTVFFSQGSNATGVGVIRRLVPGTVATASGGETILLGGRITTIAGGGSATCNSATDACGDGLSGRQARFGNPTFLTTARDGSLYVSDETAVRVRRLRADGVVETSLRSADFAGAIGGGSPRGLAVDAEGALIAAFFSTSGANSVVRHQSDGRVVKVLGQGGGCGAGDCDEAGLATESRLGEPRGVSLSPSGEIHVVDSTRLRLKRITPALPRFASRLGGTFEPYAIPSEDGALLYLFDVSGQHAETVRTTTGEAIYRFEYTSAGYLDRIEHVALGRDPTAGGARYTTIQRDATGRATSITGPFGQVTELSVDDRGWLQHARYAPTQTYEFDYAGTGGLLSLLTTPRGGLYRFAYDRLGRIVSDTDPNGRDLRLTLTGESGGRQVDVSVPTASGARRGTYHEVTPNAQGGETRRASPRNEFGLIEYPLASTTVFGPAPEDMLLPLRTVALRAGEVWSQAPDGTATRVTRDVESGATPTSPSERFAAQACFASVVEVHTPRPTWDPPTMGAPAVYQTRVERSRRVVMPAGSTEGVTDPGQTVTDAVTIGGRLVTVEDRRVSVSRLVRRVKTTAAGGRYAWLDYDAQGRVLSECDFGTVDGMGVETCSVALRTYQYLPTTDVHAGLLDRVTQGDRVVRYGYTDGRVSSVTTGPDGDTRTMTTHHDAVGRVDWIDQPGATAGTTHRTQFGYDANGVLSSLTTPRTHAHAMGADHLGQPTTYTPPAVSGASTDTTRAWRVDRLLDLLTLPSANDPGGPTGPGSYRSTYDPMGRFEGFAPYGAMAPAGAANVSYDLSGRVETLVNVLGGGGDVTVTYGYAGAVPAREQQSFSAGGGAWSGVVQDALDNELRPRATRVEAVAGAVAQEFGRQWGVDGLQERTTLAGHDLLTFTRAGDAAGRVRSIDAGWDAQYGRTTFTYDDTTGVALTHRYGALLGESTTWQTGALRYAYDLTAPASITPRRAWDAHGRITHLSESIYLGAAGVRVVEHVYTYDHAGRLEGETRTTTDPGMAPVGVTEGYTYDANGNRLTGPGQPSAAGVTYDAQDRLTGSYAGIAHTWTPRGAVNTRTLGGLTITYHYDVFGALRAVEQTGRSDVTYVNDALGRRLAKLVGGAMRRRYVYDGARLVAEVLHDASQALRTYAYGSKAQVPDVMVTGNVPYRILTDHRGSVRSVVRLSDGAVMQRMEYDAWGAVVERYVASGFAPVPFGFAGGLYDEDTGFMSATGPVLVADRETALVRFGARDYDAVTGRWMAKEPLGFDGGEVGLYTYAGNDPVNLIDVDGTRPCSFWRGFARGVGAGLIGAAPGVFVGAAASLVIPAAAAAPLAAIAAVATVASLAGQWLDAMLSGASACQLGELAGRTAVSLALLGAQRTSWYRRGSSNDQRFFSHRSPRDRLNDDWGDRGVSNASFGQFGGLPPASRPSSMGWNPITTLKLMSSGPTPMARHGLRWTAPTSTAFPADRIEQAVDGLLD